MEVSSSWYQLHKPVPISHTVNIPISTCVRCVVSMIQVMRPPPPYVHTHARPTMEGQGRGAKGASSKQKLRRKRQFKALMPQICRVRVLFFYRRGPAVLFQSPPPRCVALRTACMRTHACMHARTQRPCVAQPHQGHQRGRQGGHCPLAVPHLHMRPAHIHTSRGCMNALASCLPATSPCLHACRWMDAARA